MKMQTCLMVAGVAGAVALVSSCGFPQPPDVTGQILLTSGNEQTGTVAKPLTEPFVVTLIDTDGNVVVGFPVTFEVTGGDGSVSPQQVRSDALGQVKTTLTLGATAGSNTVEARARGLSETPVVFTAAGTADVASQIKMIAGDGQRGGAPGFAMDPFVVCVQDSHGNPVSDVDVTFAVTAGGGSVTPTSVASDTQGLARTTLTFGSAATNTVEARATGVTSSPVVFNAAAFGFTETIDLSTAGAPLAVAVGDLNGDDKPDLAFAYNFAGASVLLNTTTNSAATPSFAPRVDFVTGDQSIVVGDLNGDGKPDLALANYVAGAASVLLNTTATGASTPTFATSVDFTTATHAARITAGDFNGDGKLDLAVASFTANVVSVLLNTTATGASAPSFAPHVDVSIISPTRVAVGDLDGDGKLDLAVVQENSNAIQVFLNKTGSGAAAPSFAEANVLGTAIGLYSVAIGDLNGDGRPDIVAGASTNVLVFLNETQSAGSALRFANHVDFAVAGRPRSVAIGDINADGKPDIAVAVDSPSPALTTLLSTTPAGASTPTFAGKIDVAASNYPQSVVIGDFNGDGINEVATERSLFVHN